MKEYVKIETIYARDMGGTKKLMPGVFRNEIVEYLQDLPWYWTEKVDGTNIRIHWDGHKVEFGGRTDKAVIPPHLLKYLEEQFSKTEFEEMLEQLFGERDVIFFGEGYGAKIQNGGDYTEDGKSVGFILFDVMINGNYQEYENVHSIAKILGMDVVPVVGMGTLHDAVEYVKNRPISKLGKQIKFMEGVVCKPGFELRDRTGKRIIVKIKWEDLKDGLL